MRSKMKFQSHMTGNARISPTKELRMTMSNMVVTRSIILPHNDPFFNDRMQLREWKRVFKDYCGLFYSLWLIVQKK